MEILLFSCQQLIVTPLIQSCPEHVLLGLSTMVKPLSAQAQGVQMSVLL